MAPSKIPHDFLLGPGCPKVVKTTVDFRETDLPEYRGRYAVILDDVFTKDECDTLVRLAESQSNGVWEQALINIGGGEQALMIDSRDCGRIIWDDTDIVDRIWARIQGSVPEIEQLKDMAGVTGYGPVKRGETWKMTRLNERMRFLKYGKGQYFRPHNDGSYITPSGQEQSFYTLHLYLNDADPSTNNDLRGGETTFHSYDMHRAFDVVPRVGRVLIFQHSKMLHSGAEVVGGTKLTLRTDVMYEKVVKEGR